MYNWVTVSYYDQRLMYPTTKYHTYKQIIGDKYVKYIVNSVTGTVFKTWKFSSGGNVRVFRAFVSFAKITPTRK